MAYSYCIARTDAPSNGTGTVSVSYNGTAVTGSGTAFSTQLAAGDVLVFNGNIATVATITDNTNLVIGSNAAYAAAGASFTYTRLTNVQSLATPLPAPKSSYRPYTDGVELANGRIRGLGRPVASWRWGFISLAQRTQLRTFCTEKSGAIYIRTRTNEADAYTYFSATIIWPDEEDKQAGRRVNFTLNFKNMVAI